MMGGEFSSKFNDVFFSRHRMRIWEVECLIKSKCTNSRLNIGSQNNNNCFFNNFNSYKSIEYRIHNNYTVKLILLFYNISNYLIANVIRITIYFVDGYVCR